MQTLTRVDPCACFRSWECTHTTQCRVLAAVEAEAEEWARKVEALEAENARLRRGLRAVEELIAESGGVYGLHLNGDPAPWSELLPPGRFGDWLTPYAEALE